MEDQFDLTACADDGCGAHRAPGRFAGDPAKQIVARAVESIDTLLRFEHSDSRLLVQCQFEAARLWMDACETNRFRNRPVADECYEVALILAAALEFPITRGTRAAQRLMDLTHRLLGHLDANDGARDPQLRSDRERRRPAL